MGEWKDKSAQKLNFGKEGAMARDPSSREIKKGELLEGRITLVEETTIKVPSGASPHNYTMVTSSGEVVTFLGTASLDRLIKDEQDNLVRITYVGDVKSSSGFNVKQFKVEVYRESLEEKAAEEAVADDQEPKF